MAKKRGLGRGLDALLGGVEQITTVSEDDRAGLRQIPIEDVQRGRYQPRTRFDDAALAELAESIRAQGVIQPVVVRAVSGGFELIAGERRWRAAQLAGLHELPAVVRELDDQAAAAVALIENIQREDLNPMEEARALRRLQGDFELTHQQIADAVGRSRVAVSNLLRLLDIHPDVIPLIDARELEMGHARALLSLPSGQQLPTAKKVVSQALSVRATEALVRKLVEGEQSEAASSSVAADNPDIRALENRLGEQLGAKVGIRHGQSGKGRLEIHYNSLDELDGILAHIQ